MTRKRTLVALSALATASIAILIGCAGSVGPSNGRTDEPLSPKARAKNTVPFKYIGGHLIRVPVTINDSISTFFILDTGMGLNLISKSLCARIGCVETGSYTGKRMSGQEVAVPLSSLNALTFGPKRMEHFSVGIFDMTDDSAEFAGVEGFLSLKYFDSFAFTIDRDAIIIEDSASLDERVTVGVAVPVRTKRDSSTTGISLAMILPEGSSANLEVDTGSDSLILDTSFMSRLGVQENHPDTRKVEGKDETGLAFQRYFSRFLGQINPSDAPNVWQRDGKVMFQKIIYDGHVGNSFLKLFAVTFDIPRSRMIFAALP